MKEESRWWQQQQCLLSSLSSTLNFPWNCTVWHRENEKIISGLLGNQTDQICFPELIITWNPAVAVQWLHSSVLLTGSNLWEETICNHFLTLFDNWRTGFSCVNWLIGFDSPGPDAFPWCTCNMLGKASPSYITSCQPACISSLHCPHNPSCILGAC